MMDMMALATVPAVIAGVNLFKKCGMPSRWAPAAAIGIALFFQLILTFATYPLGNLTSTYMARVLAQALLLGLAAAGLYDITPNTSTKGKHSLDR